MIAEDVLDLDHVVAWCRTQHPVYANPVTLTVWYEAPPVERVETIELDPRWQGAELMAFEEALRAACGTPKRGDL